MFCYMKTIKRNTAEILEYGRTDGRCEGEWFFTIYYYHCHCSQNFKKYDHGIVE